MNFPDIFCYVNKLKVSQTNIEKGTEDCIRHIDSLCAINLQKENQDLNISREKELHDLKKNVVDTIRSVYFIKSQLTNNNLLNINIPKMRNHMLTLEKCSNMLKNKITEGLNELCKQERDLTIDVTNAEMKLNECSKTDKESTPYSSYAAKYVKDHELLQEVKDYLLFLYTHGGHQGGWSYKDNSIFINIYNRIKNKKLLFHTLLKMFPDMTENKITAHINWYEKYIELGNIQKIAIEKWRDERNKKPKTQPKLELLFPKSKTNCKRNENLEHNKLIMKEKIKSWHLNKQEKIKKEQILKMKKSKHLQQKQKEKNINNQAKKEQVQMWKSAKLAQQEAERQAKQKIEEREQEMKILANTLIKEFQNHDDEYIRKRLQKNSLVAQQQQEAELKQNRLRDFNKKYKYGLRSIYELRKPTQSWLNKQRNNNEIAINQMFTKYHAMKTMQKFRTPAWRVSISQGST